MNKYPTNKSLVALCVSAVLTSPLSHADDDKEIESIEKIIVLGEKTARSLKDTASSVSVIDESQLKDLTHLSLSSAVSEIANVVVLSGAKPDIRGVSGNGSATGFNGVSGGAKARVATITDGVAEPFVADLTGDTGMWDIEQIEVLRGPQSTSHGRNSIGGAMFIKTKDPSFDWEGAGRVAYRNESRYVDKSIMLSGPLIDNELAFRVTGQRVDGEDYDNSIEYKDNPAKFDLNELNTKKARFKLLWQPSQLDGVSALLSHSVASEKGNTGRTNYIANDPSAFVPAWERYMDTNAKTTSLKVNHELSQQLDYEVLIAKMDYNFGFDSYEANPAFEQVMRMNEDNVNVDLKLNYRADDLSGFVGLAYYDREQTYHSDGRADYFGGDDSTSKAIYGEVSYQVNPEFTVITGARIERESQWRDINFNTANGLNSAILDQEKTIRLPKLVLQYKLSDETTASFSARRGYNGAGGALHWEAGEYYYYDSETVNTYEIGLRSAPTSDLNISSNLFYNNYKGYQANDPEYKIANMDKVITYGAEFEVSAMLTRNLQIRGGAGLLRTEIQDDSAKFSAFDGNELSSAPGFTANLALKYWLTDDLHLGFSTMKVDEYYGEIGNTKERIAGDYTISRFNVDYEVNNWLFAAFVNNVFDKQAFTLVSPSSRRYEYGYVGIVDPRNMGVSVTYQY
ncbi:TonB-dependent receptor [Pseudoalteromonas piscicida]|uniref:TonB-dependent receptor n=1 Tax=Pseudoalteromonas piscicida TaxID=43662 RepID=UPI0030ABCFB2